MGLTHSFVSAKPAPLDDTLISGPKWNQDHIFVGGNLGAILYQGAVGVVSAINSVAAGSILISNGVGAPPVWGSTLSAATITTLNCSTVAATGAITSATVATTGAISGLSLAITMTVGAATGLVGTFANTFNGVSRVDISNAATGNGFFAATELNVINNTPYSLKFKNCSSTFVTVGIDVANTAIISYDGSGGMLFSASHASAGFKWFTAGSTTAKMTMLPAGEIGIGEAAIAGRRLSIMNIGNTNVAAYFHANTNFGNIQQNIVLFSALTSGTMIDGFGGRIAINVGTTGFDGTTAGAIYTKRNGSDTDHDLYLTGNGNGTIFFVSSGITVTGSAAVTTTLNSGATSNSSIIFRQNSVTKATMQYRHSNSSIMFDSVAVGDILQLNAASGAVTVVNGLTVNGSIGSNTIAVSNIGDLSGITMTSLSTNRPAVTFANVTSGNLGQIYFANDGGFTILRKKTSDLAFISFNSAGNITAGGVAVFSSSQAGTNSLTLENTSAGGSAVAAIVVASNQTSFGLRTYSSTTATAGPVIANGSQIDAGGAGGLSFGTSHLFGLIRIYTANSLERGIMHASGGFSWGDGTDPGDNNLRVSGTIFSNHYTMTEITDPGVATTNQARLFLQDNGSGKTQLMVRFATGAAIQLAIEL